MIPLEQFVEEDLGPPKQNNGRWLMWTCPFHKDTAPSLGVTPDNGRYYCFGCQANGDTIGWLMRHRGKTYLEACEILGEEPQRRKKAIDREPVARHVEPPPAGWQNTGDMAIQQCEEQLREHKAAMNWLEKRGLNGNTVDLWRLGFSKGKRLYGHYFHPGLVIPTYNLGVLWSIKIRDLKGDAPNKYMKIKGSKASLFGLDTIKPQHAVFVCEAELDALLLWQEAGDLIGVVATGGAGQRLTVSALHSLYQARPWFIALDPDDAGQQGVEWWTDYTLKARPLEVPDEDISAFHINGGALREWVFNIITELP